MPQRTPSGSAQSTTLVLTLKEIDFSIGVGANIDVAVTLEWVPALTDVLELPSRGGSHASGKDRDEPSDTLPAVLQAMGDLGAGAVDAKQAADD